MEFKIVVELVVVPVGAAHLQSTLARLTFRAEVSIADDVGEVVTARPMFRADA